MNETLTESPRAHGLTPEVVSAILGVCNCRMVGAGERIYSAGEPAHSVYIVLSGRVQGTRLSRDGSSTIIGEAGRGDSVGMLALLENETYGITVTAVRDSRIAGLSRDSFERLGLQFPQFMLQVTRFILKSAQKVIQGAPVAGPVGTIAMIPVGGDVPTEALADDLAAALIRHGSTLVATRDILDQNKVRSPDADTAELLQAKLEELEMEHDFVIYRGSAADADWNHVCLSRADRVLLVVNMKSSPDSQDVAVTLLHDFQEKSITRCDLVLLRGRDEPLGTLAWLEAATFDRWYHINPDHPQDLARLARWMAGKAVGLVLSGGGARGFAHLGVVRALREAGIPIDAVGGTSMGGIMAALVGCDWGYPTMVDAARRTFVESKPLRDFTLPVVSFVSGKRISRLLHETLGDRQVEDLPIPFMCVSCNLSRAQAAYHTRGSLWRALRATVAIPGVIAPTVRDGDLHVDGSAIDNMPVAAMRRAGVKTVIAVDVSPLDTFASNLPDTDSLVRPSIFRQMLRRRKPGESKVPSLLSILRRSGSVSTLALQRMAYTDADRSIMIQFDGVRTLDWQRMEEIAQLGYESARKQIANWQDTTGA